jgi:hypothetical protein
MDATFAISDLKVSKCANDSFQTSGGRGGRSDVHRLNDFSRDSNSGYADVFAANLYSDTDMPFIKAEPCAGPAAGGTLSSVFGNELPSH